MQAIILILVKIVLASGLLYGYYRLCLRDRKFHQYNRFYLLAASVLSLVLPFVRIPYELFMSSRMQEFVYNRFEIVSIYGEVEDSAVVAESGQFPLQLVGGIIYLSGALLSIYFLVRSMLLIRRMSRVYPFENYEDIRIYHTNEDGTPCSFFRRVFWNDAISLQSADGAQILRHELYHVRQGHSLDLVFMQVLGTIAWFNPFYHLVKKELQTIHEYLADQHAMNGQDHLAYAEVLLEQSIRAKRLQLSHHFFQHQIKRRITMITNLHLKKPGYFSRIMAIPMIALSCIAIVSFAHRNQPGNNGVYAKERFTVVIDAGHGGSDPGAKAGEITEQQLALELAKQVKVLSASYNVEVELTRTDAGLPGGNTDPAAGNRWRADFVNERKPSVFVSLHLAAAANTERNGIEIYVPNEESRNPFKAEAKAVASIMATTISEVYKVNGIMQRKNRGIWVLDQTNCPALIIECGFITNAADLNYFRQEDNQEKIARKILEGLVHYNNR